ncbi:hypothetical protein LTS01_026096, partial [Friedmanniomyces endolithicus]
IEEVDEVDVGGGTYAEDVLVASAEDEAADSCPPLSQTKVPFAMPWRTSSSVIDLPLRTYTITVGPGTTV